MNLYIIDIFLQDYKLNRGDIIKLGRIKFNVKEYRTRYNDFSEKKEDKILEIENPEEEQKLDTEIKLRDETPNKQMLAHERSFDSLN